MSEAPIYARTRRTSPHDGTWVAGDPTPRAPLSADQVRSRLAARLGRKSRPFFRVGDVSLRDHRTADAELLTPSGRVVLHLEVDRLSGRIVRYD